MNNSTERFNPRTLAFAGGIIVIFLCLFLLWPSGEIRSQRAQGAAQPASKSPPIPASPGLALRPISLRPLPAAGPSESGQARQLSDKIVAQGEGGATVPDAGFARSMNERYIATVFSDFVDSLNLAPAQRVELIELLLQRKAKRDDANVELTKMKVFDPTLRAEMVTAASSDVVKQIEEKLSPAQFELLNKIYAAEADYSMLQRTIARAFSFADTPLTVGQGVSLAELSGAARSQVKNGGITIDGPLDEKTGLRPLDQWFYTQAASILSKGQMDILQRELRTRYEVSRAQPGSGR